jgi:hypothetical protein
MATIGELLENLLSPLSDVERAAAAKGRNPPMLLKK